MLPQRPPVSFVIVFSLSNALLGHPTKCLRHFHTRQVEFWHPQFRRAVVRHSKWGGGRLRCLSFVGVSGGFCHDTHPLEGGFLVGPPDPLPSTGRRDARRQRRAGHRRGCHISTCTERNSTLSVFCACRRHLRCHLERTETSVCPRFTGSSRTSHCLPLLPHMGCQTVTDNRDREIKCRSPLAVQRQ